MLPDVWPLLHTVAVFDVLDQAELGVVVGVSVSPLLILVSTIHVFYVYVHHSLSCE